MSIQNWHSLYITPECNMHCTYCYEQRAFDFPDCSLSSIREKLRVIVANTKHDSEIYLELLGGEPFLKPEIIQWVITFFKTHLPEKLIHYRITTNGSILTEEILSIVRNPDIQLIISFDGLPYSQNLNRRFKSSEYETFGIVYRNAKLFLTQKPSLMIHITIAPNTIHMLKKNLTFLVESGFARISIGFDLHQFLKISYSISLFKQYLLEAVEYMVETHLLISPLSDRNNISLYEMIMTDNGIEQRIHIPDKQLNSYEQAIFEVQMEYHQKRRESHEHTIALF